MDITRPLLAYFGAVAFLLGSAGIFFYLALAPPADARQNGDARADRPIPVKLLRSAERRAEDAALRNQVAAAKTERAALPPKVETTGVGNGVASVTDDSSKRSEDRKNQTRSASDRPRQHRAVANRSYRQREAYGAMGYAPAYERSYFWR
jgi:hypothetical protein